MAAKREISVSLDEPLVKFVEERAREEDRSTSAVIRRCVAEAARRERPAAG